MSTTSQDTMPLLCELGWHRPDQLARWNDGYYFSKCMRCRRDLVRTAYGSWQLPKGYRVVWQPKPPETREEIALVPSEDVEVAGAPGNGLDFPVADVTPNDRIPIKPGEIRAPAAAPAPVANHVAASEKRQAGEEPAPLAQPQEAAAAAPELTDAPAEPTADTPLAQLSDAAPQQDEAAEEPETAEAAQPGAPGDQLRTELAVEELVQQPKGTAHTVEQQLSAPRETSASPADDVPAAAREGRKELPIAEVLRHLNATPLPEPETQPQDAPVADASTASEADSADEPDPATAEEAAAPTEQHQEPSHEAPPGADDAVEVASTDNAADPQVSSASGEMTEQLDAPPELDAAELPFVPALPPREPAAPAQELPPGWDFMAEEEEDPIGSFWDEPAPAPRPAPAPEASAADVSEPAPETEQTIGEPAPDEQPEKVGAPDQPEEREAVPVPLPETRAQALAPPRPVEPAALIAAQDPPQRTEPVRAAVWPRWMDADAEAAAPEPAAARQQPEEAAAHSQVGASQQAEPGETLQSSRKAPEPDDVPPWVDASVDELDSDRTGSRGSRIAVTAVVSIGVLALAAALAGRPGSSPSEVPQREVATAPSAAPASGEPLTSSRDAPAAATKADGRDAPAAATNRGVRDAPAAATKMPFATRDPAFVSPGKPVPMALPALPAREQAFVTASVLQCRSAPVNRSPAVRKLVRGAEVQILARDGAWASVAHKGRQCWAAARYLSTARPW